MIAALKDLSSSGTYVEASTKTGEYLDACNLLFEQGLLSHRRVNNKDSSVLENIIKENYEEGADIYNFLKAFLKA